jgi:hypothetical protein
MGWIRFIVALRAGKCARLVLRLLRRNATYFRAMWPCAVPGLYGPRGKTGENHRGDRLQRENDVSNLLNDSLPKRGIRSLIPAGLQTWRRDRHKPPLRQRLFGKAKYDMAVLEVDERTSAGTIPKSSRITSSSQIFPGYRHAQRHPQYIAGFYRGRRPESG